MSPQEYEPPIPVANPDAANKLPYACHGCAIHPYIPAHFAIYVKEPTPAAAAQEPLAEAEADSEHAQILTKP